MLCRYDGLDILKAICAFLIVCIHCPFPGKIGQYIVAVARIAVPIFFMITGFFYDGTVARNSNGKQIKRIAVLLLEANLLFFAWKLFIAMCSGDSILYFLQETITVKPILKFILLNESLFSGHLWYLGAILYVLIIYAIADKIHIRKLIYVGTPILLLVDLALGKYSIVLFGREFPYILVRNFACVGIPYFSIGCMLKKLEKQIKTRVQQTKKWILVAAVALLVMTTILERYILVSLNLNPSRDHYISSTFLALLMFVIAMSGLGFFGNKKNVAEVLRNIGRKDSAWIYIVHPVFVAGMGAVMRRLGIYEAYSMVAPILVYLVSVACVASVRLVRKKCKMKG